MGILHSLFKASPLIALLITLTLGYLVGKLTIGRFVLGGLAGTLIMRVLVDPIGVDIDSSIRNIFFALFIYAVGFQGGPRFFSALNILLSAVVMTVTGLVCVLAADWAFKPRSRYSSRLAAGELTPSSIIDTEGDAISQLSGVSDQAKKSCSPHI
ncbi:aspartate-alanine antiporter-like transporter [Shewanella surugensis]|uniref:YidE/YbjL duplication domain-containing protein n=1 Tax=Shewanella surugensis TaxID=212020 RepID=A0ABT0L6E0_9GAMM|nr:hypothetical protein [Shewanella surugensis]MCL1123257.1 hypothetical protein [Shewanella surugensis]